MLIKDGEGTFAQNFKTGIKKESSAPRCLPPETGCGRINAPHGTELYQNHFREFTKMMQLGIKNANSKKLANHIACFKW